MLPAEAPLVQPRVGEPDAMPIMHQHLQPVPPPTGDHIRVVVVGGPRQRPAPLALRSFPSRRACPVGGSPATRHRPESSQPIAQPSRALARRLDRPLDLDCRRALPHFDLDGHRRRCRRRQCIGTKAGAAGTGSSALIGRRRPGGSTLRSRIQRAHDSH